MRWLFLLLLLLIPSGAWGSVLITEVMCNPVGSDTDGEWVKVTNEGSESVDITGWKFNDGSNHTLNVPPENGGVGSMIISSGGSAYFARDASKVSLEGTVIDTAMSLNNTEDSLSLLTGEGVVMSTYVYAGEGAFAEGDLCFGTGEGSENNETVETTATTTTVVNKPATVSEVTTYRTVEIEPPQDIHIRTLDNMSAVVGSQVSIHTEVYNARGVVDQVQCIVSFGDGSQGRSCSDVHVYEYPGVYVVHIAAKQGLLSDTSQFTLIVIEPEVSILIDEELQFVEITNHGEHPLSLSGWIIKIDYKRFSLPDYTILLPGQPLKISARVLQVDMARYAKNVQIIDAFNRTIADSRIPYREEGEDDSKVLIEEELKEDTTSPNSTEQASASQAVQVTKLKTSPVKPYISVIGRSVPEIASKPLAGSTPTVDVEVVVNTPAAAVLSMEEVGAPTWGSVLPSNILPWFFGLFLLCGLAIIPLFIKVKDVVEVPEDIDADVESFTIEEIK